MRFPTNNVRRSRAPFLMEQLEDRRVLSVGGLGLGLLPHVVLPFPDIASHASAATSDLREGVSRLPGVSAITGVLPGPLALNASLQVSLPVVGSADVSAALSLGGPNTLPTLAATLDVLLLPAESSEGGLNLGTAVSLGGADGQPGGLVLDVGVSIGGDSGLSLGGTMNLGEGLLSTSVGADLGAGGLGVAVNTGGGTSGGDPGAPPVSGSPSPPAAGPSLPGAEQASGGGGGFRFSPRLEGQIFLGTFAPPPAATVNEPASSNVTTTPLVVEVRTDALSSGDSSVVEGRETAQEAGAASVDFEDGMAGDLIWGEDARAESGGVVPAGHEVHIAEEGVSVGEETFPATPGRTPEVLLDQQPQLSGDLAAAPSTGLDGLNLSLRLLLEQMTARIREAVAGAGPWHWALWLLAAGTLVIEAASWRRRLKKSRKAAEADHLGTWMREMPQPGGEAGHEL